MKLFIRITFVLISTFSFLSGCGHFSAPSTTFKGHAEIAQTPITDDPGDRHFPGKFVWHDLLTSDPLSAGKFYEQLFGWEIDYQGQYAVVRNKGKLIAGILKVEASAEKSRSGVWMPSVSVNNIEEAVRRVKANGGTILKGPIDMQQRGNAVLIRDPQQAELVLLDSAVGDPADVEAQPGDWLWDEIWTDTPERIAEFYKTVLGYDKTDSRDNYDILINKEKWRAGIRHMQAGNKHKLWVPVIRVIDPQAIVQRVEELGGVIWVAPDEAPSQGDTALISDTSGALLLIQRWPAHIEKGEL